MRRHPPHHLSPARAKHPAGPDPEAGLSRPKSPQQRSLQARKPVNSEQDSCSFSSIALSKRMLKLLGLNAKTFRAAALAASLETGQARALENAKALARAQASARARTGKPLGPRRRAGYVRSILPTMGVRGLRARVGDLQIGDAGLFDEIFKESRFNG